MRIFILEDDNRKLSTIKEIFLKSNINKENITIVCNYKEAQNYIRDNIYDLFFLDSNVPTCPDGHQYISCAATYLSREIHRFQFNHSPVIVLTSCDPSSYAEPLKENKLKTFTLNDTEEIIKVING